MKKKGMEMEYLAWILIAVAVIIVGVIAYLILSKKGINALNFIKNLLKFRG